MGHPGLLWAGKEQAGFFTSSPEIYATTSTWAGHIIAQTKEGGMGWKKSNRKDPGHLPNCLEEQQLSFLWAPSTPTLVLWFQQPITVTYPLAREVGLWPGLSQSVSPSRSLIRGLALDWPGKSGFIPKRKKTHFLLWLHEPINILHVLSSQAGPSADSVTYNQRTHN